MNTNQPLLARLIRRTAGDFGFLLVTFLVALVAFIICTTLFWVAVGTIPILIGLPLLAGCLIVAVEFGRLNRLLLAGRGIDVAPPLVRRPGPGLGGLRDRLIDGSAWRALVHLVVNFFTSIVTFVVGTVWFVVGPAGVSYGWWSHWLPGHDNGGLAYLLGYPGRSADTVVNTIVGAILLITAPWVLRGLVMVHVGLARALLGGDGSAPVAPSRLPLQEFAPEYAGHH